MKALTQLLFVLCCLSFCSQVYAQEKDDSKYLVGAVPMVDGKVLFSKDYSIPGMSQDEIFERAQNWMNARLARNENTSRIVFENKGEGQIVGIGDEWIVFSSTALSLDRTRITYQLSVTCKPAACTLEMGKIRYIYREGEEKYSAEEWITDKYALNKSKTKLVRGLAKWRKKTVDFVDSLCIGLADALSTTPVAKTEEVKVEPKKAEKSIASSGTMVIAPKANTASETNETIATANEPEKQEVIPAMPLTPAQPVGNQPKADTAYKEVNPAQIPSTAIQNGAGQLVIVIGQEPFNMTMMTANAGGSLGKSKEQHVVFCILSPDQPYEQLEKADKYTVRFYPTGQNEPTLILECKKVPSPAGIEGMPRTFIGEITKAMMK